MKLTLKKTEKDCPLCLSFLWHQSKTALKGFLDNFSLLTQSQSSVCVFDCTLKVE